ncbi:MAG TPA: hypothetical protein VEC39_05690 [Vicinamibacterales bacterium]|nr:hypothetical protein [Vicinamibacterales bacterium]
MPKRRCGKMLVLLFTYGCDSGGQPERRVVPSYDAFTGKLVALYADQNGDGRVDQWTYVDGNRVLRGESDTDGDGRVDRWEYFDRDGRLSKVGVAASGDGVEDTWTVTDPNGDRRVERAQGRDRYPDRREYFKGDVLLRAEEDTNNDGRIDRWDRFENGVLRQAEFDTTLRSDRPDRRLVYDAAGRFVRVEADDDRDGTFSVLVGGRETDVRGVRK